MYLQLAWPTLFSHLRLFFKVFTLTYPQYYEDSSRYVELCHKMSTQVEKRPPNAILALMAAASPRAMAEDDIRLEAFSFIRGGMFCSLSISEEHSI